MHRSLSRKFTFYTFICIALVLFVHGYNLQETYLTPFSLVHERLTFTTFTEYLFANGLLRFRIPMLFAISGYIFSIQDKKRYGVRVKKRFQTLVIPYLIWSAVGLFITFALQSAEPTAAIVREAALDQLGDNRPYAEMGWRELLHRWLLAPPSFQLWFIRSLFVYNLAYPLFRWGVLKAPIPTFSILFLLWITMARLPLAEGQGMFFFALGIWLQKRSVPLDRPPSWFSHYLAWLFFAGLCVIRTFIAFEFEAMTGPLYWSMMLLYVVAVSAGVMAVWFSFDPVVNWLMHKKWFVWSTAFSFFIYGLHIPLLAYFTTYLLRSLNHYPGYRLGIYLLAPSVILLFCIGTGALLRRALPRTYRVMTGGRGI